LRREFFILILLFGLAPLLVDKVYGQGIEITGGDVTLTISTAIAGQEPDPVTNESTGLRYYGTPGNEKFKITVQTNLFPQNFTLKVMAINLIGSNEDKSKPGNPGKELTLSTTPQELVKNIRGGTADDPHWCTLKYTALATVEQGTGNDVHTVTYTITVK